MPRYSKNCVCLWNPQFCGEYAKVQEELCCLWNPQLCGEYAKVQEELCEVSDTKSDSGFGGN